MDKFLGREVTITKKCEGIDTKGMKGVVSNYDYSLSKYEIDFGNGFGGWYKRSELVFDKEISNG